MENLHDIKIEEIYIQSKQNKDSYLCEDFLIYPESKELSGGYMIGIIEIRATPAAESEKIIKLIINTLKEKYYGQIVSSPDPERLNLETIFEYALQKTNEALCTFIQISHINFPIENLHYSIAIAKPNTKSKDIDLYFTHQGLIGISLLHKTKQNNFKLINVVDNTAKVTETPEENETEAVEEVEKTIQGHRFKIARLPIEFPMTQDDCAWGGIGKEPWRKKDADWQLFCLIL